MRFPWQESLEKDGPVTVRCEGEVEVDRLTAEVMVKSGKEARDSYGVSFRVEVEGGWTRTVVVPVTFKIVEGPK